MTTAEATMITRHLVEQGQPIVIALATAMAAKKVADIRESRPDYTITAANMAEIAHNARVLAEETIAKQVAA